MDYAAACTRYLHIAVLLCAPQARQRKEAEAKETAERERARAEQEARQEQEEQERARVEVARKREQQRTAAAAEVCSGTLVFAIWMAPGHLRLVKVLLLDT